jgi:hypothetical protein
MDGLTNAGQMDMDTQRRMGLHGWIDKHRRVVGLMNEWWINSWLDGCIDREEWVERWKDGELSGASLHPMPMVSIHNLHQSSALFPPHY